MTGRTSQAGGNCAVALPSIRAVVAPSIADIHRIDAAMSEPLDETDYRAVMRTIREFMLSETRGMHQLYTIVQNRPR
mgnify:CR=1 FL=1